MNFRTTGNLCKHVNKEKYQFPLIQTAVLNILEKRNTFFVPEMQ